MPQRYRHAFAALRWLGRALEMGAAAAYHAAAGLLSHADLRAAIMEAWQRFGLMQETDWNSSLFSWEKAFYTRFLKHDDRVLLIGCGTGRDLLGLLERGYRVEGLELVADCVERARQRLAERRLDARLIVGDIETTELVDRFDVFVFSWFCYAYIPESARRVAILKKLAAHLAPGGRILISYVPAEAPGTRRAIRIARAVARLTGADWQLEQGDSISLSPHTSLAYQHYFAGSEAEKEARSAGLRVLAHEPFNGGRMLALGGPASVRRPSG